MIKSSLAKDYSSGIKNYSSRKGNKIDRIVVHHMAGSLTNAQCKSVFINRKGSATYAIDSKGEIGCFVSEEFRPWTTSTQVIDNRAVTIEVANDSGEPNWHVSDKNMNVLVDLLTDICKRNGIKSLSFIDGDRNNSVLQAHKWWSATACPGPYLYSKFPWLSQEVNKRLGGEEKVSERKITIDSGEYFESYENGQKIIVYGCADGFEIGLESAIEKGKDNSKALQTVDKIDFDDTVENFFKMNGGYFNNVAGSSEYGQHYGVEISFQNEFAPKSDRYAVYAVMNDGSTIADTADNFWYGKNDVKFAISPAVVMYHKGKKINLWSKAYASSKSVATQQTMLIKTKDRFAGALCLGKLTPAQIETWASYIVGLEDLILLDSGGSTSAVGWDFKTSKKIINHLTGRKIANAIVFYRPKNKKVEEPVSEPITPTETVTEDDTSKETIATLEKENETLRKNNDALSEELKEEKAISARLKNVIADAVKVLSEVK